MHGRVKVKRTAEQEKLRKDSSEKSEHKFRTLLDEIFQFRRSGLYTDDKLKLVEKAVEIVPDMTTLWNYRREILKHLLKTDCSQIVSNTLFDNELQLTARCLVKSPKSYSVWHHRMWILKHHENPLWESENEFCISTLKQDERNFHCWDYKRFVVSHGKMPLESELAYTENEIGTNMSNYSAWHYRSELLSRSDPFYRAVLPISPPPTTLDSKAICLPVRPCLSKAELELLHNAVYTDPSDQSPWFYYWWILGRGVRTTYIRELYISRPLGRIVLVFTAPKPRSALEQLEVTVEVTTSLCECASFTADDLGGWRSVLEEDVSAVWWLPISCDLVTSSLLPDQKLLSEPQHLTLSVNVCIPSTGTHESEISRNPRCPSHHLFCLNCKLYATQKESLTRVGLDPLRLLNPLISPAVEPESLHSELENVRDLVSMEPKNKWALLTFIALLRFVRPYDSDDDVANALRTLISVDRERAAYYKEMKAAHREQNALTCVFRSQLREISFAHLHLGSIRYMDWYTLMTKIDFSNNNLVRLPDTISYLLCLQELILDDNRLTSLARLSHLPSLVVLSVQRNRLDDFTAIEELLLCPKLQSVSIDGNNVTEIPNLSKLIADHPCFRTRFQSFILAYGKPLNP